MFRRRSVAREILLHQAMTPALAVLVSAATATLVIAACEGASSGRRYRPRSVVLALVAGAGAGAALSTLSARYSRRQAHTPARERPRGTAEQHDDLLRELQRVRGFARRLRLQAHDFSNKLHLLGGLIELGRTRDALRLINENAPPHGRLVEGVRASIGDPRLAALVVGKAAAASELGVTLELASDSRVVDDVPPELLTIAGNLITNAIEAAAERDPPGTVTVLAFQRDGQVEFRVRDTGTGIDPVVLAHIFEEGFSTKAARAGEQHGTGLAQVRRLVRAAGGSISIDAGPGAGAEFAVALRSSRRPAGSV